MFHVIHWASDVNCNDSILCDTYSMVVSMKKVKPPKVEPMNVAFYYLIRTKLSDSFLDGKEGKKYELLFDIDGTVYAPTIFQLKKALKKYILNRKIDK